MFNDLVLAGLNESANVFAGPMDPRIGDITLEGANDIGGLDAMDYALQSVYELRSNMEMADMAAVCEEYAYLKTNGVEMVEEGAMDIIKEWFSKAKDAITALGKRIAEFFKKVLDKLVENTKGDGLWIKAHQKKIDSLPGTVKLSKAISGYNYNNCTIFTNYTGIYSGITTAVSDVTSDYAVAKASAIASTAGDKTDDERRNEFKEAQKPKKVFARIMEAINIKQPSKGPVKTIAQFKEALVQSVKDNATVFSQVSNVQAMVSELESGREDRKKIKKSFEDNKKILNAALNVVTTLEKNVEAKSMQFQYAKMMQAKINTQLSALVTANRVIIQTFEARRSQDKKLINAAISSNKKDQKLEESAMYYGDGDLI